MRFEKAHKVPKGKKNPYWSTTTSWTLARFLSRPVDLYFCFLIWIWLNKVWRKATPTDPQLFIWYDLRGSKLAQFTPNISSATCQNSTTNKLIPRVFKILLIFKALQLKCKILLEEKYFKFLKAAPQLQLQFDPWPWNFHILQMQP